MVTVIMRVVSKSSKSTTGMVLMRHAHCLKVSRHTQSTISLRSGESEYYGIVKWAGVGLGARSMLRPSLEEEPGDTNVSDALTKPLDEKRMTNLLTMMGYEFRDGRTSLAPEAQ